MTLPGKREDKISIEQPTQTKDSIGGMVTTWTQYARVWAHVEPMQGQEAMTYGQITQGRPYNVYLIYSDAPLLGMNMRVRFGSLVLAVQSIVKHERENAIHLVCHEKRD